MTPQRILVTGGAGFIGSHTVDLLLRQGREVIVLDNLSSGKLENLNLLHPDLQFIEGDVLEFPLLEDLLTSCDAVLHLAAVASVQQSIENPIYSFQVNTQGFLHVLEAVRKAQRPTRIVYASSAAVYGNVSELPCRDDLPLMRQPLSPYALQKMHDEDYADLYFRLYGIKSLGLRYFNVYGPRQHPGSPYSGVVTHFIDAYKSGRELTIFGDGMQSRDFIFVADVAVANSLALHNDFVGAVNIATGEAKTLLNIIESIQSVGHEPAQLKFEPARIGDIRASYASTQLAAQHLDFRAAISLEEGMRLTVGG